MRYVFDYEDHVERPVIEAVRYCCPNCGEWKYFSPKCGIWHCSLCERPKT